MMHLSAVPGPKMYQDKLRSLDTLPPFSITKKVSSPPGGYSQWQSQPVAQREEKCRAQGTNQNRYMITRTEIVVQ